MAQSPGATPQIRLRDAMSEDLRLLLEWQAQAHVIEAGAGEDWGWQTELARRPSWRRQLIAEVDGRAIGFVQIIDPAREDSRYWGDVGPGLRAVDIWIGEPADLGRGYGSAMMRLVLDLCFADAEVGAVLVDPLADNRRAHRFYRRFGFAFDERRRFGVDDCQVMRLDRNNWENGVSAGRGASR